MQYSKTKVQWSVPSNLYKLDRSNYFLLQMKKLVTNNRGTINKFLQKEKNEFFLMNEEKKTMLKLKINESGINEGFRNF